MSPLRGFDPQYTVADYLQREGDWELWDGRAVAMAPGPFARHGAIVLRLGQQLINGIERSNCDAEVVAEVDYIVCDTVVVRPDISVICGPLPEKQIVQTPALIAEVLSDSTRQRDRQYKRDLYLGEGVEHYVMLDPDNNEVIWCQRREAGQMTESVLSEPFEIEFCKECRVTIDTARLFR